MEAEMDAKPGRIRGRGRTDLKTRTFFGRLLHDFRHWLTARPEKTYMRGAQLR